MSTFLYPSMPVQVSLDFLARLDAEEPGRWWAQRKYDGYLRLAYRERGGPWVWKAKPAGSGELRAMPDGLRLEFEEMDLPAEMVYCMEWTGTRMIESVKEHRLHLFDWYPMNQSCPTLELRHMGLGALCPESERVEFVDCWSNPGLVERFQNEVSIPISEGLVIRRIDSKIKGHRSRCLDGDHCYKVKYREVRELKGRP